MNTATKHQTAPEDRVPWSQRLVYGSGAFVNNLLADSIGRMMIVLNLGLGMNPALVGLLSGLPRLLDALTDPIMGYVSDNTKSKWGRRRPYIFVGAIAVGLCFIVLWQLPDGKSEDFYFWYFLIGSLIFFVAYTIFATPWVALGYEMTPDYHERTRLMGVQNFVGQLAYLVTPWLLFATQYEPFFDNMVDGAAGLAIVIGLFVMCVGVLPAIFLRERLKDVAAKEHDAHHRETSSKLQAIVTNVAEFGKGFWAALRFIPFLKLCIATFLVFNGFIMIAAFQSYIIIYYVFDGDTVEGAKYAALAGTAATVSTFVVIAIVTWISTKVGKRRAFAIAMALAILGYVLKFFSYNPDYPLLVILPAPLLAFSLGGLFTLMPSMMADVVDLDELQTRERREGMYGSIYWWVVKLGQGVALAAGGVLLNLTGFDVALGGEQSERTLYLLRLLDAGIPILGSLIAIWAVFTFGITQDKAREVRLELERIRGVAAVPTPA
jgi:GPH family glycoside/pentoside/hexuronide:cation symporter